MNLRVLTCAGLLACSSVFAVDIDQSKGIDPAVDYAELTKYGPWDDRNYKLRAEDIALLPEDDQYLANVPAFFKVRVRREQPNLGAFYPRATYQYFQIEAGGLLQDGVWARTPLGKHYNPLPEDVNNGKPEELPSRAFVPDNETPLALGVAGNEVTIEFSPVDNMLAVAGSNQSGGQTMFYSTDGGLTWAQSQTNPSSCCDPTIDWSSDGSVVYQADLSSSIGVRAFRSTDNGQTWSAPIVITPSGSDKEFIHSDKSAASPHQDNVYITYHNGNVMQFVRSTDLGMTYQTPISFGGEPRGIGSDITTDPAGNIYYVYPTLGPNPAPQIRLLKSTDGGVSFDPGLKIADLNGRFDFPIPSMETREAFIYVSADVDMNNGHIYVAWTDEADDSFGGGSGSASQNHAWIRVAKSTDGGATWTMLPIPHDTSDSIAGGDAIDRYHPWLKVGVNGVVHIGFYDTRHSTNRTGVDFYYTNSLDGGATWQTEMRVSTETSPNLPDGQEWGDYNGLSVLLDRMGMTWTDNRESNQPAGSDKVAMAASGLNPAGSPTFTVAATPASIELCAADTGVAVQVDVTSLLGYAEDVTLSTPGAPAVVAGGVFSVNPVTPTGSSNFTFDAGAGASGDYTLTIQGEGAEPPPRGPTIVRTAEVDIAFSNAVAGAISLTAPADMATAVSLTPTFEWAEDIEAVTYVLEIATDSGFSNIIHTAMIAAPASSYTLGAPLDSNSTFYWRMRATNGCGTSVDSATFSFTTQPAPGDCPAGLDQVIVKNYRFEAGEDGFTSSGTMNTWARVGTNPHTGSWAWHADDVDVVSDQRLTTPVIHLASGFAPFTLQFWNYQEMEDGGAGCYDGGILEVSVDGGAFTQVEDMDLATDPYDGPMDGGFSNPLAGQPAWCGDPQPYLNSVVDINAYAGSDVQFRFRVGTDSSVDHPGWDIDDVRIIGCAEDSIFQTSIE